MDSKKKFILFIYFISASIFVAALSGYFGFNQSSIESIVSLNGTLAAVIYTALFIFLTSFAFSVSVMTSAGVLFFSGFEVIVYAMIGIMGSSIVDFFISKKLGREYVREYLKKRGGRLEKFDEIFEKNTFKTIFILSALFLVPPTIPNLLGGVMKISFKNYCISTFLGNLPNTIFTVFFIRGLLYSDTSQILISIGGLMATTLISLYFYRKEIRDILIVSFPWIFRRGLKIV